MKCLLALFLSFLVHIAVIATNFPSSGRTNPLVTALTIFLMLCVEQTSENSPATLSFPLTLKPLNPVFFICPIAGSALCQAFLVFLVTFMGGDIGVYLTALYGFEVVTR